MTFDPVPSRRAALRDNAVRLRDILRSMRYGAIRENIAELKGAVHSAGKMLAGLALALLAWGASQIYTDLKAAHDPPPAAAPPS